MKLLDYELTCTETCFLTEGGKRRAFVLFCFVFVSGCPRAVEETKRTIQLTLPTTTVDWLWILVIVLHSGDKFKWFFLKNLLLNKNLIFKEISMTFYKSQLRMGILKLISILPLSGKYFLSFPFLEVAIKCPQTYFALLLIICIPRNTFLCLFHSTV